MYIYTKYVTSKSAITNMKGREYLCSCHMSITRSSEAAHGSASLLSIGGPQEIFGVGLDASLFAQVPHPI
jgi:hypothetical protein